MILCRSVPSGFFISSYSCLLLLLLLIHSLFFFFLNSYTLRTERRIYIIYLFILLFFPPYYIAFSTESSSNIPPPPPPYMNVSFSFVFFSSFYFNGLDFCHTAFHGNLARRATTCVYTASYIYAYRYVRAALFLIASI